MKQQRKELSYFRLKLERLAYSFSESCYSKCWVTNIHNGKSLDEALTYCDAVAQGFASRSRDNGKWSVASRLHFSKVRHACFSFRGMSSEGTAPTPRERLSLILKNKAVQSKLTSKWELTDDSGKSRGELYTELTGTTVLLTGHTSAAKWGSGRKTWGHHTPRASCSAWWQDYSSYIYQEFGQTLGFCECEDRLLLSSLWRFELG